MTAHANSKAAQTRELIWMYLKDNPETTTQGLADALSLNEATTRSMLRQLLDSGCIRRTQHHRPATNFAGRVGYFKYTAVGTQFHYFSHRRQADAKAKAKSTKAAPVQRPVPQPQLQAQGFFDAKSFRSYCEGQNVGALRQMRSIIQEMFG